MLLAELFKLSGTESHEWRKQQCAPRGRLRGKHIDHRLSRSYKYQVWSNPSISLNLENEGQIDLKIHESELVLGIITQRSGNVALGPGERDEKTVGTEKDACERRGSISPLSAEFA